MATDDPNDSSSNQDVDFLESMQDLLGMSKEQVDELLEKLDADQLQDLTDAVAKHDKESAQQVINQAHTDEEVNALFRGKNLKIGSAAQRKAHSADEDAQFGIGDDVMVAVEDKNGQRHQLSATIANPNGPEGTDTVLVKIEGKTKVVKKTDISKLEEAMMPIPGLPELGRIQQLAGMRTPRLDIMQMQPQIFAQAEIEPLPDSDPAPDDPMGNAMAAFETLEACLPNIQVADLKCVRERLNALQQSLNENYRYGRARKI